LLKIKGLKLTTAISEYFRDQGKNVLLMIDSITRVAMAQREIGLAIGELPTSKGYTPSVFSLLPRILERAGNSERGSITGIYAVLVEGDDLTDPIADTVRSILDGHIVLSRKLAMQNHYPAVDVLASLSRVMIDVVSQDQWAMAKKLIEVLATYREAEELINIGAYVKGSNSDIDYAIQHINMIENFLRQDIFEKIDYDRDLLQLKKIFNQTQENTLD
jgi:flagellum-specific ATP synthase